MKIFHKQEADGPYRNETSFSWSETDPGNGSTDELVGDETLPIRTLTPDKESNDTDDENAGIDPYNTGSFEPSEL